MTGFRQAFLNALDGIAYLADRDGRITDVGQPAWSESLHGYGADDLGVDPPLGRCIFDAMHGSQVRAAYQAIHQAVLTRRWSHIAFEMRCDGPDVRRLLRMSVSALVEPASPPAVLYQSQLLSAVSRPWMSLFDPDRIVENIRKDGGLPIVRVCSFCHRVAWPVQDPAGWVAAEDYYRLGGPSEVRTSHGVCPRCADAVVAQTSAPPGGPVRSLDSAD